MEDGRPQVQLLCNTLRYIEHADIANGGMMKIVMGNQSDYAFGKLPESILYPSESLY